MKLNILEEDKLKTGIYQIKNIVNNKVYIGSSKRSFAQRLSIHLYELRNNKHHSQYLQKSYNKHGEENFEFSILEICDIELILEREQYWLDFSKCYDRKFGYNILQKAYSSEGFKHTEDSIKLIGEQSKKRGAHLNSVNAMKKANTGRKREKAHSDRMSKIHSVPVIQLSLGGDFVKEWDSITKANIYFGLKISDSNISGCCKGKCKSIKGFLWVKKEDYSPDKKYEYKPKINGCKLKCL